MSDTDWGSIEGARKALRKKAQLILAALKRVAMWAVAGMAVRELIDWLRHKL